MSNENLYEIWYQLKTMNEVLLKIYEGLNFKPSQPIIAEAAKTSTEPKIVIGTETPSPIFKKTREPVEEIPTRGSKTNIADIDIVF